MARGERIGLVGLVGGVGGGNTGNEVSLAVVRSLLATARDDLHFAVVTPMPHDARARSVAGADEPVLALRAPRIDHGSPTPQTITRRLVAEARHISYVWRGVGDLRALVVCGTGVLDDFEEPPWGMPWSLFLWSVVARARRRAFVLLAVGAGPITGRVSRLLFRVTVRLATEVTYRDEQSMGTMAELGASRADARVTCDLAFGHDVAPGPPARPGPGMRVGLAVMDWDGWSGRDDAARGSYRTTLVETVEGLLERGYRVLLLTGQPVDRPPAEEVRHRVLGQRPTTELPIADIETFDDLVRAVQSTDLVLATRFHAVVAALVADRPVASAGYAPKNRALLQRIGLPHADRSVDRVDAAWLLQQVDDVAGGSTRHQADRGVIDGWRELTRAEVAALASRIASTTTVRPRRGRPRRPSRARRWTSRRP